MNEIVIGLDIGTTCAKALAVDAKGAVVGQGSSGYRLHSSGCRIEQDAGDWTRASAEAVRQAVKNLDVGAVKAISLSTQGASTAAVDAAGKPMGYALTWMDSRATAEADEIEQELGGDYVYRTSGWKINPALDAAKIRHMGKDPAFAGAFKYLSTVEIVNGWMTGNSVIDPTNAAIRQLYNVEENRWDDKLLRAAGITQEQLPQVLATGAKVGELCQQAAEQMGLLPGVAVYNGAHDQYCAAIGAGAVRDGDLLLSAGTTWVLMGVGTKPLFTDSYIAPGKHPVEGLYGAIASLICSGASLQWFKNEFLPEEFDEMNRVVAQRRDKTGDLCYFPYLAGAAFPLWVRGAKGAFTGMTLEHDRFDFARAIMEGVAFGVRRGVQEFAAAGTQVQRITVMGGAAKSPVWCQMIADVTGVTLEKLNQADVCALGAAAIALKGAGLYPDYGAAARAMVQPVGTYEPQAEDRVYYDQKFRKFDRMWRCMEQFYREGEQEA